MRRVFAPAMLLALAAATPGTDAPQPPLPQQTLTIVSARPDHARHAFTVELAKTPAQQEVGLMFRTALAPDHGMLFDWGSARDVPMWMKNTLIPLDMVFIGEDHTVTHIAEDTVPQSLATIPSGGPVRATLEIPAGVAARLDIRVGDKVEGGF